ncbi:MAG TPA: hypothetical protein VGA04_08700 [Streptosporangiaceae bacterium]
MPGEATFLIDEFLEALVAQLDRTQDALAFKAVNRPLTYAIKDFNLQLQVFVDLDGEGNVRLRSSGPNEVGASTMTIAFTTITRPMIEENTVSLAATRGPSLAEAGFKPAERKRLERLGVNNTAQLRRLGTSSGSSVVSRLTEIPVDRLRAALQFGQPQVISVQPVGASPPAPAPSPAPPVLAGGGLTPLIRLAPDTSHLHVLGTSLGSEDAEPVIRLNGVPVAASEADWDRIVVPVPRDLVSGTLEVELPDGAISRYQLVRDLAQGNGEPVAAGRWSPEGE